MKGNLARQLRTPHEENKKMQVYNSFQLLKEKENIFVLFIVIFGGFFVCCRANESTLIFQHDNFP